MSWKRLRWAVSRWVVLVAGVAAWQLWTAAARSSFFPEPSAIVTRMYRLWFSGPASHVFLTADATGNILPSLGPRLRRPGDRRRPSACRSGSRWAGPRPSPPT